MAPGELARRDIKLMHADQDQQDAVGEANKGFGVFWAGLSPGVKAASVLGVFIILGLVLSSLDDEKSATITE